MSDINQVLSNVQADQATKANAWELFQSSEDQPTFTQHLNSLNLPNDAKAQIWEMKFGAGAQSGARSPEAIADYAKRYGLPLDVAERHMRGAAPAPDPNAPGPGALESLAVGVGKSGLATAQTAVRAANWAAKKTRPDG